MGGFVLFWHKGLGFCPRGFCPRGVLSYTHMRMLVHLSRLFTCQYTCVKLLICETYLDIFPAEPSTDNCFFFRTLKNKLISAILEISSFLAKSLAVPNKAV